MRQPLLVVVFTLFAVLSRASVQTDPQASEARRLQGTWKLLSYVGEEVPAGTRADVMGPHPSGYINYGPDGRMIVIIVGTGRSKPAGPVATPAEAEALLRRMLAYAGTYTVDTRAKTVTHHIDVSWDESRTGGSFVRGYRLEDNRLTLITPASTDPATGGKTVRTVTWEKVK
jgi:hypothetical protein